MSSRKGSSKRNSSSHSSSGDSSANEVIARNKSSKLRKKQMMRTIKLFVARFRLRKKFRFLRGP
ncbi:hypothetical protein F2Q69_00059153 [Brassica cretica]|uniref:Uncharacterized protein n=1 Tax=Brassica cretica TaxID=69181 RepID=A0A8S9RFW8_BRACR|nr:hypothetical protein F2Q69_00059153 [Brassica cretica]